MSCSSPAVEISVPRLLLLVLLPTPPAIAVAQTLRKPLWNEQSPPAHAAGPEENCGSRGSKIDHMLDLDVSGGAEIVYEAIVDNTTGDPSPSRSMAVKEE